MDDVVPPSAALAFVTKMIKKCKSTSPRTIKVKNWRKTIITEIRLNKLTCKR